MKRFALTMIACLSFTIASVAVAGCINDNWHPAIETSEGIIVFTDICCIEVGDGSEASCTDGDDWFNLPL
ncbi:MAG: hypothetical protein QNK37_01445 [Acidobacteriota bacterium]|nr:hypothetical protein [Acidobacteriota bacterium]